ncbi:MAG: hypothetical protein K2H52_16655 [Lachnospiraceae bacterium]|nr:hypothetical protein [Lachnospiraceae bacterium]MDE6185796.1 hypothetical protein [Lachnospiraceae bacterium]
MDEFAKYQAAKEDMPVYYTYKDRVFRLLFKDKRRLLELYNGLNGTNYSNAEELIVNTLENAIFIKMKNDLSFIIDSSMNLYEHQSSYCPNMPLRGFLYLADLYKKQIKDVDLSVSRLIKIPTPHYVVFYNGHNHKKEEFTMKLSDAFENDADGCLEMVVRVININFGYNQELFSKCQSLYGYAYFVDCIRQNLTVMELRQAVESAVNECIERNILREFLLEQKAEVITMSIYEYNEEYVRKTLYEDGKIEGKIEGEGRLVQLMKMLLEEGKEEELKKGIVDQGYREQLYAERNL